ncbi:MAG: hypothetical protein ACM3NH_00255, partial [Candidatus Saccharibacteria bacterium]
MDGLSFVQDVAGLILPKSSYIIVKTGLAVKGDKKRSRSDCGAIVKPLIKSEPDKKARLNKSRP